MRSADRAKLPPGRHDRAAHICPRHIGKQLHLQKRIRELETEVAELREIIARLTG